MATTRKPAKKATKKAAKKSTVVKSASVKLGGTIPKLKLTMPLDEKKIAAIQRCIAKGNLTVTLSKVDLAGGRLGGSYIYD